MTTTTPATAERLLDAQVAWVVAELSGDRLLEVIARDVDDLLGAAAQVRLGDVVSAEDALAVLDLLLARVPTSAIADGMALVAADLVHDGPAEPVTPGDLVDREQVAELVDAALALRPLLADALDRLTDSPRVGTLASRFITRLVVDVLEANRSMAKRIPGVGSIVSMGTSAATRMVGVADKQVQALLGDTAAKGTAIAVRRLNSVVLSTLEDPTLREAVLEVWDAQSARPVDGIGDVLERDDLRRVAGVLHEAAGTAATSAPVRAFLDAWLRSFLELHGDRPVADVLAGFGLERDDLVTIAATVVPPVVDAAIEQGLLEQAVRARLEPFFHSPEVAAILAEA